MKTKPKEIKPARKNVVQVVPADADSNIQGIDGEDFGGIGQGQDESSSETEKRKNINADPNLIQGNKLKGENREQKQ